MSVYRIGKQQLEHRSEPQNTVQHHDRRETEAFLKLGSFSSDLCQMGHLHRPFRRETLAFMHPSNLLVLLDDDPILFV